VTRLRTGTPQFGYVLPCRRQDGTAAILKLSPDAHGAQEQATALSAWAGDGAGQVFLLTQIPKMK
jgi:hypothetical protein